MIPDVDLLRAAPLGEGVWPGDGTVDGEGAGVCPGPEPRTVLAAQGGKGWTGDAEAAGREDRSRHEHLPPLNTADRRQKRPTYRAFRETRRALLSGQGHFQGQADSNTDPLSLAPDSPLTQPDLPHLDFPDVRDVLEADAVAPPSLPTAYRHLCPLPANRDINESSVFRNHTALRILFSSPRHERLRGLGKVQPPCSYDQTARPWDWLPCDWMRPITKEDTSKTRPNSDRFPELSTPLTLPGDLLTKFSRVSTS
jgi:hypothetical protein